MNDLNLRLVFFLDSDYDHKRSEKFVDNLPERRKEWLFTFVLNTDVGTDELRDQRDTQAIPNLQEDKKWNDTRKWFRGIYNPFNVLHVGPEKRDLHK